MRCPRKPIGINEIEKYDVVEIPSIESGLCAVYDVDSENIYLITNIDTKKESVIVTINKDKTNLEIIFIGLIEQSYIYTIKI